MMLLVAAVSALIAAGIELYVWTIAYPLFGLVDARTFVQMRAFHAERIAWSLGPALLVAAFGNAALALQKPSPSAFVAALAGFAVLAVTAFVQIPMHARLTSGADPVTIARLNANETSRALLTFVQAAADVWLLASR